jgi:uncharacterized repeat protein (TIGR01451 family)
MRIFRLLFSAMLLILLGGFSLEVNAVGATIKVTSIAEIEVHVFKNGKKEIKRSSPDQAVPGTEVIFTNTFENVGGKTASDIVINNPIPDNTEYKANSAFGKDCTIYFSVDGGKTFGVAENLKVKGADGKEYPALPRQYSHIRWTYKGQLASGKFGEVGFHAVIK